ncbi:MAG: metal-dependent transcriptional regulator [Planctomycetota bacterium]
MPAALTPAMEDYLEAILALSAEGGVARARDIASAMKVSRPSVTGALRHLAEHGLVNYRPYELITLTPEGAEAARRVSRRHEVLSRFFREALGVKRETAETDACRIEHGLSRETVDRLVALMEFLEERPKLVRDWATGRDACRLKVKRSGGGRAERKERKADRPAAARGSKGGGR